MLRKLLILPLVLLGCENFAATCLENNDCEGPGANAAGRGGAGGTAGAAGANNSETAGSAGTSSGGSGAGGSEAGGTGGTGGSEPSGPGVTFDGVAALEVDESGTSAAFGVRLDTEPLANVTVAFTSSDASEGSVSPASIVFTTNNWNVQQVVDVIGEDDTVIDGDVDFEITANLESGDPKYSELEPAPVAVTNTDDDVAGIAFVGDAPLQTHELAIATDFTLALTAQPTAKVTLVLASSDPTEGTVGPTSLEFGVGDWNVPRTVTVTGVPESGRDSGVDFEIRGTITSGDEDFSRAVMTPIAAHNKDFDVRALGPGDGLVAPHAMSASGNHVFLVNFSGNDSGAVELLLYDVASEERSLIATAKSMDIGTSAAVSKDGQIIAFPTDAALSAADVNGRWDVYVHDRSDGTTKLVSGKLGVGAAGKSDGVAMTSDGTFLAIHSTADDLADSDNNGYSDIFVVDRVSGTTELVSLTDQGAAADGPSYAPTISDDGCLVAFMSEATLVAGVPPSSARIYLRDRCANATTLVSSQAYGGAPGTGLEPSISADGTRIAFSSDSETLTGRDDGVSQIFVRHLATGDLLAATKDLSEAVGDADSLRPSLSADGRFVAFDTSASNLVPQSASLDNVCVRDLLRYRTRCIPTDNGGKNNKRSYLPLIDADGTHISFASNATNIVPDSPAGFILQAFSAELGDAFWNSPLIPESN